MEVLNSDRAINRIESLDQFLFDEGAVYLWVIHANKIPPHLGISHGTAFYSLKANGKDNGIDVTKIIPVLSKKGITTVFYALNTRASKAQIESVFDQFESTIPGTTTCLQPLKMIFNNHSASWLKELLSDLENRKMVKNAFGWQLPNNFDGIPDYDPIAIHQRLEQLNNV